MEKSAPLCEGMRGEKGKPREREQGSACQTDTCVRDRATRYGTRAVTSKLIYNRGLYFTIPRKAERVGGGDAGSFLRSDIFGIGEDAQHIPVYKTMLAPCHAPDAARLAVSTFPSAFVCVLVVRVEGVKGI